MFAHYISTGIIVKQILSVSPCSLGSFRGKLSTSLGNEFLLEFFIKTPIFQKNKKLERKNLHGTDLGLHVIVVWLGLLVGSLYWEQRLSIMLWLVWGNLFLILGCLAQP